MSEGNTEQPGQAPAEATVDSVPDEAALIGQIQDVMNRGDAPPPEPDPEPAAEPAGNGEAEHLSRAQVEEIAAEKLEAERKAAEQRREYEQLQERARVADEITEALRSGKVKAVAKRLGIPEHEVLAKLNESYLRNDDDKESDPAEQKLRALEAKVAEFEKERAELRQQETLRTTAEKVRELIAPDDSEYPLLSGLPEMQEMVARDVLAHSKQLGRDIDPNLVLKSYESDLMKQVQTLLQSPRVRQALGLSESSRQPTSTSAPQSTATGLTQRDSTTSERAAGNLDDLDDIDDLDEEEVFQRAVAQLRKGMNTQR